MCAVVQLHIVRVRPSIPDNIHDGQRGTLKGERKERGRGGKEKRRGRGVGGEEERRKERGRGEGEG